MRRWFLFLTLTVAACSVEQQAKLNFEGVWRHEGDWRLARVAGCQTTFQLKVSEGRAFMLPPPGIISETRSPAYDIVADHRLEGGEASLLVSGDTMTMLDKSGIVRCRYRRVRSFLGFEW